MFLWNSWGFPTFFSRETNSLILGVSFHPGYGEHEHAVAGFFMTCCPSLFTGGAAPGGGGGVALNSGSTPNAKPPITVSKASWIVVKTSSVQHSTAYELKTSQTIGQCQLFNKTVEYWIHRGSTFIFIQFSILRSMIGSSYFAANLFCWFSPNLEGFFHQSYG